MNKLLPLILLILASSIAVVFLFDSSSPPSTDPNNAAVVDSSNDEPAPNSVEAPAAAPEIERDNIAQTELLQTANAEQQLALGGDASYIRFRVVDNDGKPVNECLISDDEDENDVFHLNQDATVIFAVKAQRTARIKLHHPNWQSNTFSCQGLGPNEINDLGDIVVKPGSIIDGVVLNSSGEPLAQANVKLLTIVPRWGVQAEVASMQSQDDGSFTFGGLAKGVFTIKATSPAYQTATQKLTIDEAPQLTNIRFELLDGQAINGFVLDVNGRPIAGAEIHQVQQSYAFGAESTLTPEPIATSNSNGSFSASIGFTDSTASLRARHNDYTKSVIEISNDGSLANFNLVPSLKLSGKLVNIDGLDLEHARVQLAKIIAAGRDYSRNEVITLSSVQADGSYSLSDFEAGVYTLQAYANLGRIEIEDFRISSSIENYDIELPLTPELTVRVVDANELPIQDAKVSLHSEAEGAPADRSDENGDCVLRGMQKDQYELRVRHDSFTTFEQDLSVWQDKQHLDIVLKPAAVLHVKVTNENGEAVEKVLVKVKSSQGDIDSQVTDSFGAVTFAKLADGVYDVFFDIQIDFEDFFFFGVDEEENGTNVDGELGQCQVSVIGGEFTKLDWVVSGLCSLDVIVTNNGEPAEGMLVALEKVNDEDDGGSFYFRGPNDVGGQPTDSHGQLTLSDKSAGAYTLKVSASESAFPISHDIYLNPGRNQFRVDLTLNSVSGRLILEGGFPAVNNSVSLIKAPEDDANQRRSSRYSSVSLGGEQSQVIVFDPEYSSVSLGGEQSQVIVFDMEGTAITSTDSDGYFTFKGVPNGDWQVVARKKNYIKTESENIQIGGGNSIDIGVLELGTSCRIFGIDRNSASVSDSGRVFVTSANMIKLTRFDDDGKSSSRVTVASGDGGAYSFDEIVAGTYILERGDWASEQLEVRKGSQIEINIPLAE